MIAITKREIAFIDRGVDDFATLFAGIRPDVRAIQPSNDETAPRQMARAVEGREGPEAIHVIAHGRPDELSFGAGALSPDTIIGYAAELAEVASDPLDIPSLTNSHSTQPILNFFASIRLQGTRYGQPSRHASIQPSIFRLEAFLAKSRD
jgi:hypothetical protein